MTTLPIRNSISRSPLRCSLLLIPLSLCCFALCPAPKAFGVSPPPDGGYAGANTAEGQNALQSLTSGQDNTGLGFQALYHNNGSYNTAEGFRALFSNTSGTQNTATGVNALISNTTGNFNTANGVNTLYHNTTGTQNTATGYQALYNNTTSIDNTANGFKALLSNTTGFENTAIGSLALFSNTTGSDNTANGYEALYSNTTGSENTANGYEALYSNTTGVANTATGSGTLVSNTTGSDNTANGYEALIFNTEGVDNNAVGYRALYRNTTGSFNVAFGLGALDSNVTGFFNTAIGISAGANITGNYNIDIGNFGVAFDSNTIRIGDANQTRAFIAGIYGATASGGIAVYVNSDGQLGTATSSARFKQNIRSMDKASEAILALKPVTFRYKPELDPTGTAQFGLVAEEVEKVNPDLVARDAKGEPYTVRYEAVNAMLLNEFLKEHRKVEEQEATITQLKKDFQATAAHQQTQIEALTAGLQKVSAQLKLRKPAPQTVANNQ